ncbi:MAG: tRNA 4-thiouridine(8) synthase ThiI [Oscillospiraceae bacterium]|nr:tRNA 4-thiouridine(8) synthase ThiI [Oscillospiraceae bacterium]
MNDFKRVILVRYGEIALKGLNRHVFEDKLISNIRRALGNMPKADISISQGRIFVEPIWEGVEISETLKQQFDFNQAIEKLKDVFGIVSVSLAYKTVSNIGKICDCAKVATRDFMEKRGVLATESHKLSFKVETKRGNKRFPMISPEISAEVGGAIAECYPDLEINVNKPDFIVYIEVRESAYAYTDIVKGYGGLPLGTNGKAALLLSGGIDSPVAGFMMAKRGVEIDAVHFYSYPYTSEKSKEKVIALTEALSVYTHRMQLHIVPFTDIQVAIRDNCHAEYMTIVTRRAMMIIAEAIALSNGAMALVTGESMGQVASQTIQSLGVTNSVVKMPVFRPLIGMDKVEVVEMARRIGTFEISSLPYEDCCTLFTPKHPKIKPKLDVVEEEEKRADLTGLIKEAVRTVESMMIYYAERG